MELGHTRANFPDTRWTLVQKATDREQPEQQLALEELCAAYWPPVYAFVRSKGHSPSEAEDLTQGFFQQLLERQDFDITSAEKGKLRTFLLCAMQNFLRNDWKHRNRLKRGGDVEILPILDEAENQYSTELSDGLSPEQVFERQWVLTLLDSVLADLEKKYDEEGKSKVFAEIKVFIIPSAEQTPRREVADRLGMPETHLNVAVHRLRKQYREKIREAIAETLHEDVSVDDELRHLMSALQG